MTGTMQIPNPRCSECHGTGRVQEGTGNPNSEGGEDWREVDCPLCYPFSNWFERQKR